MIDIQNHHEEYHVRSAHLVEQARTIDELLSRLGFSFVVDRGKVDKDTFMEKWRTRIVGEPKFQSQQVNEIYDLTKNQEIRVEMRTWQILWWATVLLNPFGLVLRSLQDRHFRLEENRFTITDQTEEQAGEVLHGQGRTVETRETTSRPFPRRIYGKSSYDKEHVG